MFNTYEVDPELIKQNPEWLSHKTVTGKLPKGSLIIENVTIKKTTFIDFEADKSIFRNVIFEDCRFIKVSAWECLFENVIFKGGLMANKDDPYFESNRTDFSYSTFKNVTLDGLKLENPNLNGINGAGTRLLLINMNLKNVPYSLIGAENVHVRIKKCNIQGEGELIVTSGTGSVYATDSVFDGTGFLGRADVTYVENCQFLNGSSVGDAKTIVIKDSAVLSIVGGDRSKNIHLINNTYLRNAMGGCTLLLGSENTKIYVDGHNMKGAFMDIYGGGAYIKDLEIIGPIMRRVPGYDNGVEVYTEPYTLDLNNVTIRGGRMDDVRLRGGRWQDVEIYPPIKAPNAHLQNVQAYNVRFPDGPPWTETDANTSIELIKSPKPFDFPEIKAPTPQELGLVD